MNHELLMALVPGLFVTVLMVGAYKTFLEKKDTAKEHIQDLLTDKRTARPSSNLPFARKDSGEILKKRKKKKGEIPSFNDKLEIELERANLLITPPEFILISLGVGALVAFAAIFLFGQNPFFGVVFGVLGCLVPKGFVMFKTMMRMAKAAREFADVLDSMVNGFKTGYGFNRAIAMISENFSDPWSTEFGKMAAEMNLGLSQEEALWNLSARIPSQDVDLFITGILIQKETGGNMSELLGTLSKTIRERYKLLQKVGAISAQGKLSAGIVCCVPFALMAMMFMFLPDPSMKFITNPIGMILMGLALFWMACGIGVLYKIVQIEV